MSLWVPSTATARLDQATEAMALARATGNDRAFVVSATLRCVARRSDGTEVLRGTCVVYTMLPADPA